MTPDAPHEDSVPAPWWARLLLVLAPLLIGVVTWWVMR